MPPGGVLSVSIIADRTAARKSAAGKTIVPRGFFLSRHGSLCYNGVNGCGLVKGGCRRISSQHTSRRPVLQKTAAYAFNGDCLRCCAQSFVCGQILDYFIFMMGLISIGAVFIFVESPAQALACTDPVWLT
jgi:hypothetical protein